MLAYAMLSHFSRVRLCATPEMAAHRAPPSLGFSGQEHWRGLPFPSPMRESEVTQSCPTLSNPMDCSLTGSGSSVRGIFQARVLEWVYYLRPKSVNCLEELIQNSALTQNGEYNIQLQRWVGSLSAPKILTQMSPAKRKAALLPVVHCCLDHTWGHNSSALKVET